MANRPNSSGPDSSAGSSVNLPAVSGMNKMGVLPEEWTLPHEWKIEKRELFDNSSLQTYPHPEVGSQLTSMEDVLEGWERENQMLKQSRKNERGMQIGLSRNV